MIKYRDRFRRVLEGECIVAFDFEEREVELKMISP